MCKTYVYSSGDVMLSAEWMISKASLLQIFKPERFTRVKGESDSAKKSSKNGNSV